MSDGISLTILGNQGPYPGRDGACSGYLVRSGRGAVCVELGPGSLAHLQRHTAVTRLNALIISHYHADHLSDILTLRYALRMAQQRGTLAGALRLVLPAAGMDEFLASYIGAAYRELFDAVPVEDGSVVNIEDLVFTFHRMKHGVESFGMTLQQRAESGSVVDSASIGVADRRVLAPKPVPALSPATSRATLGYTSDTGPCEALEALAAASRVLLAECGFSEAPVDVGGAGHLWPDYIGSLARGTGLNRLILTHFAPDADQPALVRAASEAHGAMVWGAAIGETYEL